MLVLPPSTTIVYMQEGKVVGKGTCRSTGSLGEGAEMSVGARNTMIGLPSSVTGHGNLMNLPPDADAQARNSALREVACIFSHRETCAQVKSSHNRWCAGQWDVELGEQLSEEVFR